MTDNVVDAVAKAIRNVDLGWREGVEECLLDIVLDATAAPGDNADGVKRRIAHANDFIRRCAEAAVTAGERTK